MADSHLLSFAKRVFFAVPYAEPLDLWRQFDCALRIRKENALYTWADVSVPASYLCERPILIVVNMCMGG